MSENDPFEDIAKDLPPIPKYDREEHKMGYLFSYSTALDDLRRQSERTNQLLSGLLQWIPSLRKLLLIIALLLAVVAWRAVFA